MNDDASEKLKFNIPKNENQIKWMNTVLFYFSVNLSVVSINNWGPPPPKKKQALISLQGIIIIK